MASPQAASKGTKNTSSTPPSPSGGNAVMRMTVYFQQAEWNALKEQAEKDNTTMASLVRRAVQKHLGLK